MVMVGASMLSVIKLSGVTLNVLAPKNKQMLDISKNIFAIFFCVLQFSYNFVCQIDFCKLLLTNNFLLTKIRGRDIGHNDIRHNDTRRNWLLTDTV
jgi:hypothetical protein